MRGPTAPALPHVPAEPNYNARAALARRYTEAVRPTASYSANNTPHDHPSYRRGGSQATSKDRRPQPPHLTQPHAQQPAGSTTNTGGRPHVSGAGGQQSWHVRLRPNIGRHRPPLLKPPCSRHTDRNKTGAYGQKRPRAFGPRLPLASVNQKLPLGPCCACCCSSQHSTGSSRPPPAEQCRRRNQPAGRLT